MRQNCGLGCPPEKFTTNACETANFMLKNKVDYKRSELSDFVKNLINLLKSKKMKLRELLLAGVNMSCVQSIIL